MNKQHRIINWIARIVCGLALVFFGMFILGDGIPDLNENSQVRTILFLMAFAAFAYFFAWFKPKEGGITLTLAGAILGLNMFYYGGVDDTTTGLIFALPFIFSGLMFWWVGTK